MTSQLGRTSPRAKGDVMAPVLATCELTPRRTCRLPPTLLSPGAARTFVEAELCPEHGRAAVSAVQLVASEMVTHAVVHGSREIELALVCRVGEVVVTVTDDQVLDAAPVDATDRLRLALVAKIGRATGVEPTPDGEIWWCTVPTGVAPVPRQVHRPD
jgi:hypothetical protein